jgi:hypothetical protein
LKGLKSMRHYRRSSPYESVDDFDWDD